MEIEEGVIRRGHRPRRIAPSEISIILHKIRKPNSIIVINTGALSCGEGKRRNEFAEWHVAWLAE